MLSRHFFTFNKPQLACVRSYSTAFVFLVLVGIFFPGYAYGATVDEPDSYFNYVNPVSILFGLAFILYILRLVISIGSVIASVIRSARRSVTTTNDGKSFSITETNAEDDLSTSDVSDVSTTGLSAKRKIVND